MVLKFFEFRSLFCVSVWVLFFLILSFFWMVVSVSCHFAQFFVLIVALLLTILFHVILPFVTSSISQEIVVFSLCVSFHFFFLLFAKNSKKGICPPFQFLWGFIFPTISASLKWSADISFFGRKIFFCEHTTQRYPFPCTKVQYIYELFYMFVDKRRQDEVSE